MRDLDRRLASLETRRGELCVSDYEIDRLLVGELDRAEADAVRTRIEGCAHCTRRFESLARSHRELRPPPQRFSVRPARSTVVASVGALAMAAAAVFLVLRTETGSDAGVIRLKGADRFGYTVVTPDGRVRGDQTSGVAAPGDELQWHFRTVRDAYVAVLSRDEDGHVSVYFPEEGFTAPLVGGAERILPTAVRLVGLGQEDVVGVVCTEPMPLETLQATLESGATEPPPTCKLYRYTLTRKPVP